MRYLSVCSGIEAATVAWHPLGWTPAAFSEIEAFPRAVLAHHYPDVPLHGDFTTIEENQYGPIDLLVGGTPCQDFSVAGLRAGITGDRGNLTLEFLRLASRTKPRWIVWENVPGVLSSDGGRALGAFLGGLAELGYGFAYRVLDAQYFGLAQRRARVFVVGYLGDWRRAAAVLFERESLLGHPAPRREAGKGFAPSVIKGAAIGRQPHNGPQYGDTISDGSCYTLNCTEQHAIIAPTIPARTKGGGGLGTDLDLDGGLIPSIAHCLNAGGMGRQDYETETLIAHALRAEGFDASEDGTGRGTPLVTVFEWQRGATQNIEMLIEQSPTLIKSQTPAIAFDTTQITSPSNYSNPKPGDPCHPLAAGAHAPAVAFSIMPMNSGKDYKARETDVAQPLMAGGPVGGNQGGDFVVNPAVAFIVPVPIDLRQASRGEKITNNRAHGSGGAPGHGVGNAGDPAFTVSERGQAVAFDLRGREGGAQFEGPHDTANMRAASGGSSRSYVAAMQVRRLTPMECERLQGFPDCYTLVPYRGKPAADGPRYKALGNSMAVPVMAWIGRRIAMVERLAAEDAA